MPGLCEPALCGETQTRTLASTDGMDCLSRRLKEAGQEHLVALLGEKKPLADQLAGLDLAHLSRIFKKATQSNDAQGHVMDSASIAALQDEEVTRLADVPTAVSARWRQVGLEALQRQQVAIVTLAGGQGTRLGSSAPKGCYDIGLPSHKSLFQVQAERLARLAKLANVPHIPWYIMTSGPTHAETVAFFLQHRHFGLAKEHVHFFQQGLLPCFDLQGKLLLDEHADLCLAPDGNGGVFTALLQQGILADLASAGIQYLHVYCVDNVMVKIGDPVFLGYCLEQQAETGSKVVEKVVPEESVGLLCKRQDRFTVCEYSEMDARLAGLRNDRGQLRFRHANIVNHFFALSFLRRILPELDTKLQYHVARKKIAHLDVPTGAVVKPTTPNGIKLELFIFDVFPLAQSMAILEVSRQEEFSPLKNGPGAGSDCPETARRDLLAAHARYLAAAGAPVTQMTEATAPTAAADCCAGRSSAVPATGGACACIELSPLLTYAGEEMPDLSKTAPSLYRAQTPFVVHAWSDLLS